MTSQKDLGRIMGEIGDTMLRAIALGLGGRQEYESYKHLLPPEVTMISFPSGTENCAGYALDLGRSTSEPELYMGSHDPVLFAMVGGIYVLSREGEWTHFGKIIGEDRARSKWGWAAPIFEHPIDFFPDRWDACEYFMRR